jgi:hypothetical protein
LLLCLNLKEQNIFANFSQIKILFTCFDCLIVAFKNTSLYFDKLRNPGYSDQIIINKKILIKNIILFIANIIPSEEKIDQLQLLNQQHLI